jgi:hypothetical protein
MDQSVALTKQQQRVLQLVYDEFRAQGKWPEFGDLDRRVAQSRRGFDLGQVVRELPAGLLLSLWSGGIAPQPGAEMKLTTRGLASCEGSADDAELFLHALRWFARQEIKFKPSPGQTDHGCTVTSRQLMRAFRLRAAQRPEVQRLGRLLLAENWGWTTGPASGTWDWQVGVSRDVRRFGKVASIEDYIAAQEKWYAESRASSVDLRSLVKPMTTPEAPSSSAHAPYVSEDLIEDIKQQVVVGGWNVEKLVALLHELNDNFTRGNTYACHAVLRAVLDHVPPLYGCGTFEQVANNFPWSRTDKRYAKLLLAFRTQGDDALHRMISRTASGLTMDDLPRPVVLRRLLAGCPHPETAGFDTISRSPTSSGLPGS